MSGTHLALGLGSITSLSLFGGDEEDERCCDMMMIFDAPACCRAVRETGVAMSDVFGWRSLLGMRVAIERENECNEKLGYRIDCFNEFLNEESLPVRDNGDNEGIENLMVTADQLESKVMRCLGQRSPTRRGLTFLPRFGVRPVTAPCC